MNIRLTPDHERRLRIIARTLRQHGIEWIQDTAYFDSTGSPDDGETETEPSDANYSVPLHGNPGKMLCDALANLSLEIAQHNNARAAMRHHTEYNGGTVHLYVHQRGYVELSGYYYIREEHNETERSSEFTV